MVTKKRDIQDVIWAWFVAATELPADHVIWSDQPTEAGGSAPQPDLPFAVLNIPGGISVGVDEVRGPRKNTNSVTFRVVGQREVFLTTQILGPDAGDYLELARMDLARPSRQSGLQRAQVEEVTVGTPPVGVDYEVIIDGHTVTVPESSIAPRDDLIIEINSQLGTIVTATPSGADIIIITSKPGLPFALAVGDGLTIDPAAHVGAVDLAFLRSQGPTSIPQLRDDVTWEERTSLDFFWSTSHILYDTPGVIESIEGLGQVDGGLTGPVDIPLTVEAED